jgi:PAS domain S-box-containing protein
MTMTPDLPAGVTPASGAAQDGVDGRIDAQPASYRALVNAMPALVVTTTPDGVFEYISEAYERYTGLTLEQARDWEHFQIIHPDDYASAMERWGSALTSGEALVSEMRLRRHDGVYRWHTVRGLPVRSSGGDIVRWVTVSVDIQEAEDARAERARAEQSLEGAVQMYRTLTETLPAILLSADLNGSLIFANRRWYDFTGVSSGESLDDSWARAVHPEDRPRIVERWARARAEGVEYEDEYRLREAATGVYRWHFGRTVPVRGPDGAIVTWIATLTDVDERRRAEEQEAFLADASMQLNESIDYDATLDAIARLAVPRMADWCGVFTENGHERDRRIASAYDNPLHSDWDQIFPQNVEHPSPGIVHVMRTGEPWLNADLTPAALRVRGVPEEYIENTTRAGFTSSMLLPVASRGHTAGMIIMCGVSTRRNYDERDLRVATEFARGASLALENARLYRESREAHERQEEAYRVLDTLVGTAPIGVAYIDRALTVVRVNDALAAMKGVDIGDLIDRPLPERRQKGSTPYLHPIVERVLRNGEAVIDEEVVDESSDFTGTRRWLVSSYPVRSADGTIDGVGVIVDDVTERRAQEDRERLSELRYRMLANTVPQVVWTATAAGDIDFFNERWYEYTGLSYDETKGWQWELAQHPDDLAGVVEAWRRAVASGAEFQHEMRLRRHDGQYRWHLGRATPLLADDGHVLAWFGTHVDIDDRKREEVKQRFLSDASKELGSSLDYHITLARVAQFAVPEIADWCAVDVLEGGELRRLATAHVDPEKVRWVTEVSERYPPNMEERRGLPEVLRTGKSEFWAEIPEALLVESAVDDEHLRILRDIGFTSAIVVPMSVGADVFGAITFVTAESKRRYEAGDLALAEDLGRRAAIAIENARLYSAERAARNAAEYAAQRVTFLSDASRLLASSLNYDKNLRDLAQLMVPQIADWCAVDVIEDGELRRIAITNADPQRARAMRGIGRRYPLTTGQASGSPAIMRGGETVAIRRVTDKQLERSAQDAEQLRMLRDARFVSYVCVPLNARGRTLGAITLITTEGESGRELGDEDRALAEEVASRAAIAVDNARLFAEAQLTAAELRVANQAKDEFLGLVSHELRTPITTIFGNAQVLHHRGGRLDDETREQAIADIEQESDRLHRIIDNMLVLSRLEAGKAIETEPLSVDRAIARIVGSFRQRQPSRPVDVDVEAGLPPVSAEPVYFEQVLRNLLSNADKYSPAGAPIEVQACAEPGFVRITVLDRGAGIAPEDAPQLFRAFYRSARMANQASGAGIGLAVCKRLIEAQGGRIWARPRDGGGAEFGFTLPLEEQEATS